MYDGGKIITGLAIFVIAASFPVLYDGAMARRTEAPQLEISADAKNCVESTAYMRENHMNLLHEWRDMAVRQGITTYVASDGKTYDISLTGTCLGSCHANQSAFCDRCHQYAGVQPNCWNCHNKRE